MCANDRHSESLKCHDLHFNTRGHQLLHNKLHEELSPKSKSQV